MTESLVHIPDAQLLIFTRNLEKGKVKTRMAHRIGDGKALQIYKRLLVYTYQVAQQVPVHCTVYYSSYIPTRDTYTPPSFEKCLQQGKGLGARMGHAFQKSFAEGYKKVVIIGSDCYDLRPEHLWQAFSALDRHDAVIGPAHDGGYYLLGTRAYWPLVFAHKAWGTSSVLSRTLAALQKEGKSYTLLPTLSDLDEVNDLPSSWR